MTHFQGRDRFSGPEKDGQRPEGGQAGRNKVDASLNNSQDDQFARVPCDIRYGVFAEKPRKSNYGCDQASRKKLVITD